MDTHTVPYGPTRDQPIPSEGVHMTAARFCPNCGEPIEPGAKFCISCGMSVADMSGEPKGEIEGTPADADEAQAMPPAQDTGPQEVPPVGADDANGAGGEHTDPSEDTVVFPPQEGAPDVTQRIPVAIDAPEGVPHAAFDSTAAASPIPARPTIGSSADPRTPTGGQEPRHSSTIAFSVIITAALVIVGCLVYLLVAAPRQRAAQQAQSERQTSDASSGNDTSNQTTKGDDGRSAEREQKFHDALVGYYNDLPNYDSRIKSVASTFNSDYLSASMSTRRNDAKACSDLKDEIQSKVREVTNLDQPDGTAYKEQYDLILRCYRDHLERVSCIDKAWGIDLGYANPSDHRDEITRPIDEANMPGTDKNAAMDDYQRTYPQISL